MTTRRQTTRASDQGAGADTARATAMAGTARDERTDSSGPEAAGQAAIGAADALAQTVQRLHRALGGEARHTAGVGAAMRQLWLALDRGDVCLERDDLSPQAGSAVQASPVVCRADATAAVAQGRGDAGRASARPLVLAGARLYTWRYWAAEQQLAQALARVAHEQDDAQTAIADAFDPFDGAEPGAAQRRAVALSGSGRLLVLTGGPGTGKTFTLAAVVRVAVRRFIAAQRGKGSGSHPEMFLIAVAAPTGKATARLADAIGPAVTTPASSGPGPRVLLQAMTLHRLLGIRAASAVHEQADPLPYDLVVVDECSMVDALMAHKLLARLSAGASLVLAGDRDQLASVQAGAFFSAVCQTQTPRLAGRRVVLDTNYRQKEAPEIATWADAVRQASLSAEALPPSGRQVIFETGGVAALIEQAANRLQVLVGRAAGVAPAQARILLEEFLACQVLSLLRSGPTGVDAINRQLGARLGAQASRGGARWWPGRLVVVRRNASRQGLYNGDIGLCVSVASAAPESDDQPMLAVAFADAAARDGVRLVLPGQMPAHEDAWALTVHQAQGSDFDEVLLLPAPAAHRLANREGLYTALTRARQLIRIFALPEDLVAAARTPMVRRSGLLETLDRLPAA